MKKLFVFPILIIVVALGISLGVRGVRADQDGTLSSALMACRNAYSTAHQQNRDMIEVARLVYQTDLAVAKNIANRSVRKTAIEGVQQVFLEVKNTAQANILSAHAVRVACMQAARQSPTPTMSPIVSPSPTPTILNGNTPLDPTNAHQWGPQIYGDKVVWDDFRSGTWGDIYIHDLSKNETSLLLSSQIRNFKNPKIFGNRVIYEENLTWIPNVSAGDPIIRSIDITTGTIMTLGSGVSPAVYGDRVVWIGLDSYLYLYDFSTGQTSQIASTTSARHPAIYDNKVVYSDNRDGDYDIYLYDLNSGTELQITNSPCNQEFPDIFGDTIVWVDQRNTDCPTFNNGNSDIYMYNLVTQQESAVASTINAEFQSDIYGNSIVYTSFNNIYLYNLLTGTTTEMTHLPVTQWAADIYENVIVWMDYRGVAPNIYGLSF